MYEIRRYLQNLDILYFSVKDYRFVSTKSTKNENVRKCSAATQNRKIDAKL